MRHSVGNTRRISGKSRTKAKSGRVLLAGTSAIAVLAATTAARAQCVDNFNYFFNGPNGNAPVSNALPLGTGTAVASLVATMNTVNTAFLTGTSAFVTAPGGARPDQQGGGVWGRAVVGTSETTTHSTGTFTVPAGVVPAATGKQNCVTTTRQNFHGYQFGHDISALNISGTGTNIHFGATAGYFESKSKDNTPGGSFFNSVLGTAFTTPSGTFEATSRVPFAGVYLAATQGNFFADAMARFDYYENRLSDTNNGLFGQPLNARGVSVTGNVGYNIALPGNWFIEPGAGIVWSRVNVDQLSVAGVPLSPLTDFARGTVSVDQIDSLMGRLSITTGTRWSTGSIGWEAYLTGSVFHEFAGDVNVRSTLVDSGLTGPGGVSVDGATLRSSIGRIGTYYQIGLGTAAKFGDSGWLGYLRADYRTGENIESISGNLGLRYQFQPPRTAAASVKDSGPVAAAPGFNWTGVYVGASSGAMKVDQDWVTPFGGGVNTHDDVGLRGYLAGGQAGYNLQLGSIVVGVEGDAGRSNSRGGHACDDAGGAVLGQFDFTCRGRLENLASLSARLGFVWGRALLYAKGGVANGEIRVETSNNRLLPVSPSNTPVNGETKRQTGWTVGAGMEFALNNNWTAKAEYMHYDLGSDNYRVDGTLVATAKTAGDIVRVGVNYHFK